MNWKLHFLDADKALSQWIAPIRRQIARAKAVLAQTVDPGEMHALDIVVGADPACCVPQTGIGGFCGAPSRIDLSIDPGNPALARSFKDGECRKTFYHEFHHALRWKSVGYGENLGEAIVSEGLAQHFERQMEGGPVPLPARANPAGDWPRIVAHAGRHLRGDFDHEAWFFGGMADDVSLPHWTGYALGYAVVGAFLGRPAETILERAWSRTGRELAVAEARQLMATPRTPSSARHPG
jgi:uncharacterized protein YjaZ